MDNEVKKYGFEIYDIYPNIYHALVADNKDPEFRNRLKIKMSAIYDGVYDYWAEPFSLPMCNDSGMQLIPKEGDIITVMFKGGDTRYPVWGYAVQTVKGKSTNLYDKEVRISINSIFLSLNSFAKKAMLYINDTLGITIENKVSLGKNNVLYEPAIKGNTLEAKLTDLINSVNSLNTNISSLTTAISTESVANAAALPILAPASTALVATTATILANTATITANLANITSTLSQIKCVNTENN